MSEMHALTVGVTNLQKIREVEMQQHLKTIDFDHFWLCKHYSIPDLLLLFDPGILISIIFYIC